jgi:hypothetical protein
VTLKVIGPVSEADTTDAGAATTPASTIEFTGEERLRRGRAEPYVAVIRFTDCAAASRRSFSSREQDRDYLGT